MGAVFNRLLPQTPIVPVRVAIVISVAIFMASAARTLLDYTHAEVPHLFLALFLCTLSFFLWRLQLWAKIVAQWLLAFIAFAYSFAIFLNPFFLTDYEAANGGAEPSWHMLLALLFLVAVPACWSWWCFICTLVRFARPLAPNYSLKRTAAEGLRCYHALSRQRPLSSSVRHS